MKPRYGLCSDHEPYVLPDGKAMATCRCNPLPEEAPSEQPGLIEVPEPPKRYRMDITEVAVDESTGRVGYRQSSEEFTAPAEPVVETPTAPTWSELGATLNSEGGWSWLGGTSAFARRTTAWDGTDHAPDAWLIHIGNGDYKYQPTEAAALAFVAGLRALASVAPPASENSAAGVTAGESTP